MKACTTVDISYGWPEQRELARPGPCVCGEAEACPSCGDGHMRIRYCASCAAVWAAWPGNSATEGKDNE